MDRTQKTPEMRQTVGCAELWGRRFIAQCGGVERCRVVVEDQSLRFGCRWEARAVDDIHGVSFWGKHHAGKPTILALMDTEIVNSATRCVFAKKLHIVGDISGERMAAKSILTASESRCGFGAQRLSFFCRMKQIPARMSGAPRCQEGHMIRGYFAALALFAAITASPAAAGVSLNGAGGTAIYPVLSVWAQHYDQKTGTAVNYQSIGSGGGIHQIEAKTVDFANS
ncbi:MAG TPA: substrate-binding domain-containing protein, partial [Candidatus Sulfotelmatobacter sp.]|nr:substrate-binding domain-containing protein [Candidatus Sulfotelmatobacter sp.]